MTFERNIGRLVREWRMERGMSQEALATAVGLTQPSLSKIESGTKPPSIRQLMDVLSALGMSLPEVAEDVECAMPKDEPAPLWERFDD